MDFTTRCNVMYCTRATCRPVLQLTIHPDKYLNTSFGWSFLLSESLMQLFGELF